MHIYIKLPMASVFFVVKIAFSHFSHDFNSALTCNFQRFLNSKKISIGLLKEAFFANINNAVPSL